MRKIDLIVDQIKSLIGAQFALEQELREQTNLLRKMWTLMENSEVSIKEQEEVEKKVEKKEKRVLKSTRKERDSILSLYAQENRNSYKITNINSFINKGIKRNLLIRISKRDIITLINLIIKYKQPVKISQKVSLSLDSILRYLAYLKALEIIVNKVSPNEVVYLNPKLKYVKE